MILRTCILPYLVWFPICWLASLGIWVSSGISHSVLPKTVSDDQIRLWLVWRSLSWIDFPKRMLSTSTHSLHSTTMQKNVVLLDFQTIFLNTLSDEPDVFLTIIPFHAATGRIMRNLGMYSFVLLVSVWLMPIIVLCLLCNDSQSNNILRNNSFRSGAISEKTMHFLTSANPQFSSIPPFFVMAEARGKSGVLGKYSSYNNTIYM